MMKQILKVLVCTLAVVGSSTGQQYDDYGDYSQDNLYHDYAMKQQEKELQA
jgi:hypothetical protein